MKRYYYTACVIIFIFTAAISGKEDSTIIWMHPEQPPYCISKGFGAGMGIIDCTEKIFEYHLKNYSHTYLIANSERVLTMIKQKDNVCSVPLIKTPEREKYIEFSIPYRIVLSNALIISESQKNKFNKYINKAGAISLEGLIENGFVIGIAQGRAYRGIIDDILKKNKGNPRIFTHSASQNMVEGLIRMMIAERIDALIAYPFEATYVQKIMQNEIILISIPIQGMEPYGVSSVGCSKTREGKEIIKRLNSIIIKNRKSQDFMNCTERWLDPTSKKRFREYTKKKFKE